MKEDLKVYTIYEGHTRKKLQLAWDSIDLLRDALNVVDRHGDDKHRNTTITIDYEKGQVIIHMDKQGVEVTWEEEDEGMLSQYQDFLDDIDDVSEAAKKGEDISKRDKAGINKVLDEAYDVLSDAYGSWWKDEPKKTSDRVSYVVEGRKRDDWDWQGVEEEWRREKNFAEAYIDSIRRYSNEVALNRWIYQGGTDGRPKRKDR